MKLGELIKEKGIRRDFIQKELGISRYTLINWLKGRTAPDIYQANQLKTILNLNSIDELIAYGQSPTGRKEEK